MSNIYQMVCDEKLINFIQGEYIKRNFEYTSSDVDWLINNWDMPIKFLKLPYDADIILKIGIINDLISYYNFNQSSTGLFIEQYKYNFDTIIRKNKSWCEKMVKIGNEYNLQPAELVHPYKIDTIIEYIYKNKKIDLPLANKISQDIDQGFDGVDNLDDGRCLYFVDIFNESFSIDYIISQIKSDILNKYICKVMYENIKKYNEEIDKTVKQYLIFNSGDSSLMGRLYGILRWDYNLEGVKRNKFRDKIKDLGWDMCDKDKDCKSCYSGRCDSTLKRQLYTAIRSIQDMEMAKVSSTAVNMPEEAKLIMERIPLPALKKDGYHFF